ncbi:MAG TPA: ABC transporter permease [Vicinamibacterales bacterium]|nr:ABC transporter permease [Vicinamibacterales bacterium]
MTAAALLRRIVRLASYLVPHWRRSEWAREWNAELDADRLRSGAGVSTVLDRSAGAVADALVLRGQAMYLDLWWGDMRLAWRNAVRRPGFTVLVTLTLALGLGGSSAVFALIDAVLLRPLPLHDPSRLVFLWQTLPQQNMFEVEATPFDDTAWKGLRSLSSLGMATFGSFSLTGGDAEPERLRGARMTASMMPTLGITPALGRGFAESEDVDAAPRVAILSDGLWRRRFGADPAVLGRPIEVDGDPGWTVIGVMPPGAIIPGEAPQGTELWLPMRMSPSERISEISHNYAFVGRLADGVTFAQASNELNALAARLAAERPSHARIGARLVSVEERTARAVRPGLLVAAASVALLLLVAAANASTLLIARAADRRQELAIRAALGATRWRLLSLSIAESILFACIGGLAGLALAAWMLRGLVPLFASSLPPSLAIDIDARAALFTAGLAIVIGLVFGAVASSRSGDQAVGALAGARRSTASASVGRARNALVVLQIALAVVLLSAAGLMVNTIGRLSRVNPGFAADHLLTFRVALAGQRYAAAPARTGFVADMLQRLAAVPGVQSVTASAVVPFTGVRNATVVEIEGRQDPPGTRSIIDQRYVWPGYFDTMRIPLVSGRALTNADDSRSEHVVVINRTMARQYFPNENPIDRRVRITSGFDSGFWMRIVGIADDVRHIALTRDAVPEMYQTIPQTPVPNVTFTIRAAGEPTALMPAARAALRAVDATLPAYDVQTMDDRIAASFAQTRVTMLLLLVTSLLAAVLAGVAIYGAIWHSVVQRTQEIGVRAALGASRALVFREVVSAALALAAIGGVLGAAGTLAAGPLLNVFLFDTRITDPLTYAAVLLGVMALALAASIVPAIRATRVDPITALRAN